MAIDKGGEWWIGDSPEDLREYLESYADYPVQEFRLANCNCGSNRFQLWSDDDEGVAKRQCVSCQTVHLICDSEEYWDEPQPKKWTCIKCTPENDVCNVSVAFSLYDDGEVRWLYVGERCAVCGILGSSAQWKVAYSPSRHLLSRV